MSDINILSEEEGVIAAERFDRKVESILKAIKKQGIKTSEGVVILEDGSFRGMNEDD